MPIFSVSSSKQLQSRSSCTAVSCTSRHLPKSRKISRDDTRLPAWPLAGVAHGSRIAPSYGPRVVITGPTRVFQGSGVAALPQG
eukprot:5774228-Prymnesium_polylepis.1